MTKYDELARIKLDYNQLQEAALWALEYFAAYDESNAKVHCAPVRYSPLTFRLAEAMDQTDSPRVAVVLRVMQHSGQYEEDRGRE